MGEGVKKVVVTSRGKRNRNGIIIKGAYKEEWESLERKGEKNECIDSRFGLENVLERAGESKKGDKKRIEKQRTKVDRAEEAEADTKEGDTHKRHKQGRYMRDAHTPSSSPAQIQQQILCFVRTQIRNIERPRLRPLLQSLHSRRHLPGLLVCKYDDVLFRFRVPQ